MTREYFIKKWLGSEFPYCEGNKCLMRDDLDKIIKCAEQQVKNLNISAIQLSNLKNLKNPK